MTSSQGLAAEIVTTGTEILLGEIVDTNAAWIAQQLRESGINLYFKTTVGDNEARLRTVLEAGMARSNVILITGGLGPTKDDITRDAVANATGCPLQLDEAALVTLKARFARFGVTMTENNVQQVYLPQGAILIENPVGTAPGFIVETPQATIIAMPGVPREMKRLMQDTVLPYLRQRNGNQGVIRRRVLRTVGIGESTVDHELRDLMSWSNPTVGLAAHLAQVDVRITAHASTEAEVEALLDQLEADIRGRIGRYIYSATPGEPFVTTVAALLQQHQQRVALFETNTGGAVARQVQSALDDSSLVAAAWSSASADAVRPGAPPDMIPRELVAIGGALPVSEESARQLARQLATVEGATYGLAILSTMGEDEGVFAAVGGETWIGLASPDQARAVRIPYGGTDETTRVRTGMSALVQLWRALQLAHPAGAAPAEAARNE